MITITGNDVAGLRALIGLSASQFADLMGVHAITPYKWEAKGDAATRMEPAQAQLFVLIQEVVRPIPDDARSRLGEEIARSLIVNGRFRTLYAILAHFYDKRTSALFP